MWPYPCTIRGAQCGTQYSYNNEQFVCTLGMYTNCFRFLCTYFCTQRYRNRYSIESLDFAITPAIK